MKKIIGIYGTATHLAITVAAISKKNLKLTFDQI